MTPAASLLPGPASPAAASCRARPRPARCRFSRWPLRGALAAPGPAPGAQRHRIPARDRTPRRSTSPAGRPRRPASTARSRRRSCAGAKAIRVTLAVTNRLSEPSSIHWHGVRTPSPMDGVPGLSFPRHRARRNLRLPLPGASERHLLVPQPLDVPGADAGSMAPIVIEPKGGYAQAFDRDYVVLLSDWSFEPPETHRQQSQIPERLLQLRPAHARHLYRRRRSTRASPRRSRTASSGARCA